VAGEIEFELPENLTVSCVHPVHEHMEKMVDEESNDKIVIKASAVQRTDTAGLQLLFAFVVAAQERNIQLSWIEPSEKLLDAAEVLGMQEQLAIQ